MHESESKFHTTINILKYFGFHFYSGEKYKEAPPDALDMFKELHNSKKKGITPAVQSAIVSKLSIS
jgi:hypothetical protein